MTLQLNKTWFYNKCASLNIHKRIYIGYSGGVDSSVLLHLSQVLSKKFLYKIRVIHINHFYNKRSFYWSYFCKTQCDNLKIPINIYINKIKYKKNIEEYFRLLRYNLFSNIILKNSSLLLGHNKNDFIETIFLNLFRGSGLNGLSGIKEKSKLKHINILRPLLNIDKSTIVNYAYKNKIRYIIDFSNFKYIFNRNYLRYNLFYKVFDKWPDFKKSIYSCSVICHNTYDFIYKKCMYFFKSKGYFYNLLSIKYVLLLPKFWRYEIFRLWIKQNNYTAPSHHHVLEIDKILHTKNSKTAFIKIKNYKIQKYKKHLCIEKVYQNYNKNTFIYVKNNSYNLKYKKIKYIITQKTLFNYYKHLSNKKSLSMIKYKKKYIILSGIWITKNYYKISFIIKNLK